MMAAETSRIFVRGLPPNLSADEFKKHFSKPSPITDAKFIPHRRIGYVGYKTPQAAVKAVKYFNKSFMRMSRIGVELARPVEEQKASHESKTVNNKPFVELPREKRKYDSTTDPVLNPKLQEFLQVMQPPSKTKTWTNEDAVRAEAAAPLLEAFAAEPDMHESDGEYQSVPKRRKKADRPVGEELRSEDTPAEKAITVQEIVITESSDIDQIQRSAEPISTVATSTSDQDWLRSRTSRLLGLVGDDDDVVRLMGSNRAGSAESYNELKALNSPQIEKYPTVSDAGSQTKEVILNDPSEVKESPTEDTAQAFSDTGRLFIRNLSYETSEADLMNHFSIYGSTDEVHVPTDPRTGKSKGFAYLQFKNSEDANRALEVLDGTSFQGRLLHIIRAAAKKEHVLDEYAISKLPIKKQKQIRRKAEASSATFKWNSMYMNTDAVMSSISNRLGISKSEILDPTSSDAAVRQAHAETNIIQETKAYFSAHGVNFESFKTREFNDTVILVKNFAYGTSPEELRRLFEAFGSVSRLLLPPSGTIAIVELEQAAQARAAFGALSYRKFKDSVLFLEKAPRSIFDSNDSCETALPKPLVDGSYSMKPSTTELLDVTTAQELSNSSTLFVRNLNFSTTNEQLVSLFQPLGGFMSARVKTRTDPKRPGQILSMGFGFLEFRSQQQAKSALEAMNGYMLDGHALLIKPSQKTLDAAEARKKEDQAKKIAGRRTKIIIKNLPFEATKKDVRSLFGSYGQLRSVRVPKKFDSSTRGFAFADFVTSREAENAMDALKDTHLLGRRLVLDFAAADAIDPEEEIERMQKKVGKQADKVALQKLTGVGRKKFNVQDNNDVES